MYSNLPEKFGEGESAVFKMPNLECTSPNDAEHYAYSHSLAGTKKASDPYYWGKDKCPVHSIEKDDDPWLQWAEARELYARAEDDEAGEYFLQEMLSHVTETVPPRAPYDYGIWMETESTGPKTRTKTWHDIDGRPHTVTSLVPERRILAIHWVMGACLLAWLGFVLAAIILV